MFVNTDWIEQRYQERERRAWRKRTISESSPAIYGNLWDAILVCIDEAKRRKETILTNGEPYSRKAYLSVPVPRGQNSSQPRELRIVLRDDSIVAHIGGQEKTFKIDLDDNNIAQMIWDGEPISVEDAARVVMDKYLFPDLADGTIPTS